MVSVRGGPCGAEHLLLIMTSNRSMDPDTVQVMVRVVAVVVVTWMLMTGPGGSVLIVQGSYT